ncbi:hypothetical protein RJ639_045974 [Escallonia herrerae]|uniref:Uncharacterized protein n=1 Tax=Escallonia herrerae TaxID=1293975 RepID=A0AA88WAF5_9ASTE|nr:hypothetical protein RJ639_045974 [Escallonia herrerae]
MPCVRRKLAGRKPVNFQDSDEERMKGNSRAIDEHIPINTNLVECSHIGLFILIRKPNFYNRQNFTTLTSQPREVYGLYKDESPTLCPRCLSERESLNEPHGQTANNLKWATYEKLSSAREILGGHGAARHLSEKLMTSVWISALVGDFIKPLVEEFVECYLSPRRELEADYIVQRIRLDVEDLKCSMGLKSTRVSNPKE